MWNDVKIIAKNKNFVFLTISFMLTYAVFGTFGFVLSPLLSSYGYGSTAAALIAMGTVFFGSPAAILTGRFLDKTNKYHASLKVETVCVGLTFLLAIYDFTKGTIWSSALFCITAGFSLTPSIPICFQLGCELTHPV